MSLLFVDSLRLFAFSNDFLGGNLVARFESSDLGIGADSGPLVKFPFLVHSDIIVSIPLHLRIIRVKHHDHGNSFKKFWINPFNLSSTPPIGQGTGPGKTLTYIIIKIKEGKYKGLPCRVRIPNCRSGYQYDADGK